jgi:hypothetical protein
MNNNEEIQNKENISFSRRTTLSQIWKQLNERYEENPQSIIKVKSIETNNFQNVG